MKPHPRLRLAIVVFGMLAASCTGGTADSSSTSAPPESSMATTTTTTTTTTPPTTTSSTSTTTTEPPVPPLVAWVDETLADALEVYAADFEAATGIPVVFEVRPLDGIVAAAVDAIASGAGPDLFVGSHRWARGLADAGTIEPVPVPDPDRYSTEAREAFTVGGELVGVPFWFRSPVLLADPDLVPSADGSATDLDAVCEADGVTGRCLAIPSDDPAVALAIVNGFGGYGFAYGDGGFDLTDIGLDSPEALAAADYLAARSAAGALIPAEEGRALFAAGDLPFLVDWALPDTDASGWAAYPFRPDGAAGPASLTEVWGFMVAADSDQQLAAQVLLTDFIARDNPMFEAWLADGRLPARTAAFQDVVQTDPAVAAFSPADRGAATLALPVPGSEALLAELAEALGRITTGQYTDEAPDARSLFAAVAERLRAAAASTG